MLSRQGRVRCHCTSTASPKRSVVELERNERCARSEGWFRSLAPGSHRERDRGSGNSDDFPRSASRRGEVVSTPTTSGLMRSTMSGDESRLSDAARAAATSPLATRLPMLEAFALLTRGASYLRASGSSERSRAPRSPTCSRLSDGFAVREPALASLATAAVTGNPPAGPGARHVRMPRSGRIVRSGAPAPQVTEPTPALDVSPAKLDVSPANVTGYRATRRRSPSVASSSLGPWRAADPRDSMTPCAFGSSFQSS